jgi:hypothetical protein
MTRALPSYVAPLVQPMPPDFTLALEDHGTYVRWCATLTVTDHGPFDVELGYSRAAGRANEETERINLRESVWQAMELARLGQIDLLGYCAVDRHKKNRPISRPQIVASG